MLNVIYAECHLCLMPFMLNVIFMLNAIYAECHLCLMSFMLNINYAEWSVKLLRFA